MFADELTLTPSAARVIRRTGRAAALVPEADVTGHLVAALLQEESLAGAILRSAGVRPDMLPNIPSHDAAGLSDSEDTDRISDRLSDQHLSELSPGLLVLLHTAQKLARRQPDVTDISSEHLLAAVFETESSVRRLLLKSGLTADAVMARSSDSPESCGEAIPVPFEWSDDEGIHRQSGEPAAGSRQESVCSAELPAAVGADVRFRHGRVFDACFNRAREGLRVLEDCARFLLDDARLTSALKAMRHRLRHGEQLVEAASPDAENRIVRDRDTPGDVATGLTNEPESRRAGVEDIVHANARRVQEALRSLEEFGKFVGAEFAEQMKQMRYESYSLHQQMVRSCRRLSASRRREQLRSARLCVLITESGCCRPWQDVVFACLDAGVDMLQLREKRLNDRELFRRADWMTGACRRAGALCIINDRADVAEAVDADGVHVGQDDLSPQAARAVVGPERLVGLSTHSREDIVEAVAVDVDYLGVGPVFDSATKSFDRVAGPELLRQAAEQSPDVPWFAIGGIDLSVIDRVLETGAARIAVSAAVIAAEDPQQQAAVLRRFLPPLKEPLS